MAFQELTGIGCSISQTKLSNSGAFLRHNATQNLAQA